MCKMNNFFTKKPPTEINDSNYKSIIRKIKNGKLDANYHFSATDNVTIIHYLAANGLNDQLIDLIKVARKKSIFLDLDAKAEDGYTPIMYALLGENYPAMGILVRAGADPTLKVDKGRGLPEMVHNAAHKYLVEKIINRYNNGYYANLIFDKPQSNLKSSPTYFQRLSKTVSKPLRNIFFSNNSERQFDQSYEQSSYFKKTA